MRRLISAVVMSVLCACAQGTEGPVGPVGPAGASGKEGSPGAQGPSGPAGQPGTGLLVVIDDGGTVALDGGLAVVAGAVGSTGPQGPQGPGGPQGPQGLQGLQGVQGLQGLQGVAGPAGSGNFVDLTTAQSIGGAKTFTATPTVTSANPFTDFVVDSSVNSATSRLLAQVNGLNIGVVQALGPSFATTSRQNALELMNATPSGPVSVWAGGSERMRVLSNGNVGLSTAAPDATLVVTPPNSGSMRIGDVGCGAAGGYAGFGLYGPLTNCLNYTMIGDPLGNLFINRPAGNNALQFRQNNSNQVIIEPFGGLVVDANGANTGSLQHTAAANNGLTFGVGSGEGVASARSGAANTFGLDFYTNFTKQLSLTASGKVGIGIAGPGAKLHVVDNASFDPTSIPFNHVLVGHSRPFSGVEGSGFCSSGSSSGNPMCMTVNNSHITWSQVLGSGTGMKMDLDLAQGNLLIGGTLTQNSSAAFKKDITYLDAEAMESALQMVKDTPIATYRYKTMSEDTKVVYGVIAEKTPSALLAQDDKGVNLSTTIGVLMASVKAQQAHIEQLEARLAKFELAKKQGR